VVLLRDGEWSWWCRCCRWRSKPVPQLALVTTGHVCGGSGRPSDGAWIAAPVPLGGGEPGTLVYASDPAYKPYLKRGWFIV
jgi:hypothetical protein